MKLKKHLSLLMIVLLFMLNGCTNYKVPIEQSKINFRNYYESISEIAASYNFRAIQTQDPMIGNQDSYMDVDIVISENEKIYIRFINSSTDYSIGTESFSIEYFINNSVADNAFRIDLFADLVNCISGQLVSKEFCSNFLMAPEKQYSAEDYGHIKTEEIIIYKYYPLNFMEDWSISYMLTETNEEMLIFGGYTKLGIKS